MTCAIYDRGLRVYIVCTEHLCILVLIIAREKWERKKKKYIIKLSTYIISLLKNKLILKLVSNNQRLFFPKH